MGEKNTTCHSLLHKKKIVSKLLWNKLNKTLRLAVIGKQLNSLTNEQTNKFITPPCHLLFSYNSTSPCVRVSVCYFGPYYAVLVSANNPILCTLYL